MNDPTYHLEGVIKSKEEYKDFEGPLNLILMLLSKNKIEIRDIKIADILDQYLAYLEQMQEMDLDLASEFVQMASHLLYIKTKTMLTTEEEVSELELLMQSLEQVKAKEILSSIQKVTPELKVAYETGMLYCAKLPEVIKLDKRDYEYRHEPKDMLLALMDVFSRGNVTVNYEAIKEAAPRAIPYGVKEKSRELINILKSNKSVSLNKLYKNCHSRSEVVATFIAILELCSIGSLEINASDEEYNLSFIGGDENEILDRIMNDERE